MKGPSTLSLQHKASSSSISTLSSCQTSSGFFKLSVFTITWPVSDAVMKTDTNVTPPAVLRSEAAAAMGRERGVRVKC